MFADEKFKIVHSIIFTIDLLSLRSSMTMTFQGMFWFWIDDFNAVTLNDLALHHRGTKGIANG
ncbi:unnamed protein product [Brassica oleracea var. botrytis]|uniref:(rape) hypothetical protein n=1 Tax=Brassica napus TaxID=3708 RepID=A0A816R684_BRANA|nr:unnamed protein product [Brassica napus]